MNELEKNNKSVDIHFKPEWKINVNIMWLIVVVLVDVVGPLIISKMYETKNKRVAMTNVDRDRDCCRFSPLFSNK